MKRSRVAKLILMGSGTFLLAGCSDPSPPPSNFSTLDQCLQSKQFPEEVCKQSYEEAKALYEKDAPHFGQAASCEQQFGAGNCAPVRSSDGSSWFLPAMAGYMIANALNSNDSRQYNSNLGGYGAGRGAYTSYPNYGAGTPYSSAGKYSPQPKATTTSRGGFGSLSAARGSWGG